MVPCTLCRAWHLPGIEANKCNIITLFLASLVWQVDVSRLAHGIKPFSTSIVKYILKAYEGRICISKENDKTLNSARALDKLTLFE